MPLAQRILLRLVIGPFSSKLKSPAQTRRDYERMVAKLIDRVSAVSEEARRVPVLVDPMPGLEDSSRYWSLNGVLEHLMIVSRSVEAVILSLSEGTLPDAKADIAKLKPRSLDQDRLAEYAAYAPGLLDRLDRELAKPGRDLASPLKFHHPWFGGFKARQWYWLLGVHQAIHGRQAKEITRGLVRGSESGESEAR